MEAIEIIAKHHKEWIDVARRMGAGEIAEDIVQDTYIRLIKNGLCERFVQEDVNRGYMWLTIRSVFGDYLRQNKTDFLSLEEVRQIESEDYDLQKHEASLRLASKIEREIRTWDWYDQMLFNVYRGQDVSIRKLAESTKISPTSIFHTLKLCKQRLRDNVGCDYQDYLNTDYELI